MLFLLLGGATGDRTPDLMTASHALSQLSYNPTWFDGDNGRNNTRKNISVNLKYKGNRVVKSRMVRLKVFSGVAR